LDEFETQTVRFKPESLDNLVKLTKFNKRELKLMYRGFKQLCPSGVVKEDKFKLIYAQFFPRGAETNSYARFVFNSFDVQKKQEITFTDFVIGLSVLTRGTIDEQLRWIFTLYDLNGDGIITKDEFCKIVSSVHDLMGRFALNSGQSAALEAANKQLELLQQQQQQTTIDNATQQSSTTQANSQQQIMANILLQQQNGTQAGEEQADSLFRKFDLNNDGMITLDEFLQACHGDDKIIKSISVFNTIF